uniref:Complex 1 LYR protein domain-containing protein n=1 Tax=Gadus morhua TaxID=8049 RepID=A0A8C5CLP3_GADMO
INMATKTQVLSLYRMLLRESKQFPSYNYRTYALQRIKDAFRANRRIEDPKMVAKLAEEGHKTLALIKRQVKLRHTHLYTHTRIHTCIHLSTQIKLHVRYVNHVHRLVGPKL